MKKLLILLVLFSAVAQAQNPLQIRRGLASARPTLSAGEPGLDKDSLDLWMGSDSGNVLIGGRSVVYGKATFAKDAGSTDAYAITLVPAPTKYWNGMRIAFRAKTANSGSASLNVNSLGAKTIYRGATAADTLQTGDVAANQVISVIFSDSAFFLQTPYPTTFEPYFWTVPDQPYGVFNASSTVGGADSVVHVIVFRLLQPMTVNKIGAYCVSISGSGSTRVLGMGIYNMAGTLLTGGVNTPSSGAYVIDVSNYTLPAGSYYFAFFQMTNNTLAINMRAIDITVNAGGLVLANPTTIPLMATAANRGTDSAMPSTLGTLTVASSGIVMPQAVILGTAAY